MIKKYSCPISDSVNRLKPYLSPTRLLHSRSLSDELSANIWLKLECEQPTGSFKVRGALNKVLKVSKEEPETTFITASTGNHGAAVAYAASLTSSSAEIWVPKITPLEKIHYIRNIGARIRICEGSIENLEEQARAFARKKQFCFISPYNDTDVIEGQGTIAFELSQQLDTIDFVLASVGGGGLISGIGQAFLDLRVNPSLVGCSPKASSTMFYSMEAGHIVEIEHQPTLSDATAGGIEKGSITFQLCRNFIDEKIEVDELDIAGGISHAIETEHILIEGAAAVTIGALRQKASLFKGKTVVLILCGANIGLRALSTIWGDFLS